MSQNKTVVPGMEDGSSKGNANSNDFYSRSVNSRGASKGTVVPGIDNINDSIRQGQEMADSSYASNRVGKPVAGFLYSISRQGIGEYWPLYQGQNTLGSSPKCDVCLREGTVSGDHAVIVIRKMKNPEKTIASISDARSTNGTMVNGESLGFSAMECFNGDIITIGENYELVLLLIDVKALGLKVAENFIALNNQPENTFAGEDDPYVPGYNQPRNDSYPPRFNGTHSYDNSIGSSDGTVGLSGSDDINSGGTVGF